MKDFLGNELKVGQEVAFVGTLTYGDAVDLWRSKIVAIRNKKVKVAWEANPKGRLVYASKCIGLPLQATPRPWSSRVDGL